MDKDMDYEIAVVDGSVQIGDKIGYAIQTLELEIKKMEEAKKEYREKLLKAMEEAGVTKIENQYFKVSYTEASSRVGIDSEKLKTEFEEVYLKCLKKTATKSSITITLVK